MWFTALQAPQPDWTHAGSKASAKQVEPKTQQEDKTECFCHVWQVNSHLKKKKKKELWCLGQIGWSRTPEVPSCFGKGGHKRATEPQWLKTTFREKCRIKTERKIMCDTLWGWESFHHMRLFFFYQPQRHNFTMRSLHTTTRSPGTSPLRRFISSRDRPHVREVRTREPSQNQGNQEGINIYRGKKKAHDVLSPRKKEAFMNCGA